MGEGLSLIHIFSVFLRKVLIARLSPISALDTLVGDEKISDIDDASLTFAAKVDIDGGNPIFTWTTKSNLWTKKVYTLTCREDNFSYKIKAVSYTHLDVYKRQFYNRRRRKFFSLKFIISAESFIFRYTVFVIRQ